MKKFRFKGKLIALCTLTIVLAATGITLAVMSTKVDTSVNNFVGSPAKVNIAVIENDNSKKYEDSPSNSNSLGDMNVDQAKDKKVQIVNADKSASAYVRVRIVPTVVKDNEATSLAMVPKLEYSFSDSNLWGYDTDTETYYYKEPLVSGAKTEPLLEKVTLKEALPTGYHLEISVLADAIASNPETNLQAWKMTKEKLSELGSI